MPHDDHSPGASSVIAASHSAHTGQDTRGAAPDASILNVRVELSNVERIKFTDTHVGLDVYRNGGQLHRLYQAAFGRVLDKEKSGYWLKSLDSGTRFASIVNFS